MADKQQVVKVGPAPAWLVKASEEDRSTEGMQEYRVLPTLKIIQAMSAQSLKDKFGEGSVILPATGSIVASKGQVFQFVALAFFTEFCKWSDLNDTESPSIIERTFDKGSKLAACARDGKRRFEPYGPPGKDGRPIYSYRHVEHLCFAGWVYGDHPLAGMPVIVNYARGEFNTGQNLCTAAQMRREGGVRVPLWAQIWDMRVELRNRGTRKWFGIQFSTPANGSLISEEEAPHFKAQHDELQEIIDAKRIVVEHSEDKEDIAAQDAADTEM